MEAYCVIPLSFLAILATVANLSMVIHILKGNSSSFVASLVFKLIGLSNTICGVSFFIQWMAYSVNSNNHVLWVLSVVLMIAFSLQSGFNVSLAFLRYKLVINAFDYYTSQSKRRLERKLTIAVFSSTLLLCFVCATLKFLFNNVRFMLFPVAISRVIACILLCIFYAKLYFAMKSHDRAVVASTTVRGQQTTSSKEVITRRKKKLHHTKRFFIGVITSFFVLNLPSTAVFFIVNQSPNCKTWQGLFSIISIGLSCVNMVFDSIWYFYMEKRSRRL